LVEAALRGAAERQSGISAPEPAAKPTEVTLTDPRNRVVSLHIGTLPGQPHIAEQILHLIDVTAFKDLESQILQSRKMQPVGQLAGGIAHDFNNLLTAMIGFCDLLLLRHRAGDQSFADIMQIKQNANRAASLVRQLLAFSRQQQLRPRVLDITDTLTELSHLLRRLIGQMVVLKMMHGRDLGLVKVDQGQFEQVIINLAVNARDAMPNGGSLTIKTQNVAISEAIAFAHETMPPGDYVQIDVIDSGTGIEDSVITRIFEPFFTTKPVGSGTGLGLSTVYGIVRQTDGFIAVKSALGHGTLCTIYLPRYAGPAQIEERTDDTERGDIDTTGSGTILLVEDEDPVRLFTGRALRNKGYRVLEARSGEAAIQLLDGCDEQIDMLITDAVMPVIDGPTLIKLVRQHRPDIKVICISGHTDEALRASISDAGDVLFLAKPFSLKQLATCVKERLTGGVLP
jgi:two-component system cell cycle sensor histidine kinase/response regulator CckA